MVTEVQVEGDGPDAILVTWELVGGDAAVDLAVGSTPESIDHTHAVTVAAGERRSRLVVPAAGRHYVSVSLAGTGGAVVSAERRLPFAGAWNFRDLGGYRTDSGLRTRWGKVFRADALHALTPADQATLSGLGLRAVYDLRSEAERQSKPNALPDADRPRTVEIPLLGATAGRRMELAVSDGEAFLLDVYRRIIAESAPVFGRLLGGLAEPDGLPAVFHCAAGKDRTGLSAAILLCLLGVDEEDVLDDYEMTSRNRREVNHQEILTTLTELGMPPEAAAGLLTTPRWVMQTILTELREGYGGAEGYVTGPVGMSTDTVAELRRLLLV